MGELIKAVLVVSLAAALMLAGPMSAIAVTTATPADAAVNLTSVDLTAALETAANDAGYNGVREVKSVTGFLGLIQIVSIVDNDGVNAVFAASGPLVEEVPGIAVADMDNVNDVAFLLTPDVGSPYVQPDGPLSPGIPGLAIAGDIGGEAVLRISDFDGNKVDISIPEETTATSVAFDWTGLLGETNSAPPVAVTLPTGYSTFDWVTGLSIADTDPLDTAANFVENGFGGVMGPNNWAYITGSHNGRIIMDTSFAGSDYKLISSDISEVQSVGVDWTNNSLLVTGMGNVGIAKMFEMSEGNDAVELNLPPTIDTKAGIGLSVSAGVTLVGGTGRGAAHLYKRRPVAGEFINLDYMVAGMENVNDIYADPFAGILGQSAKSDLAGTVLPKMSALGLNAADAGPVNWMIGGSGVKKLVAVYSTPLAQALNPAVDNTVSSDAGGASVTLPAGSVPGLANYDVTVEKVASGTPAVPGGLSLLGTSYEFNCYDNNGNPVTTFNQPVTITIDYDPTALNGMSEDSLIIYYYDTADSTWKAVTPSVVDKINHTLTITVSHFTQFGVLGATATALPYTGR
jgi:hypothetical protein